MELRGWKGRWRSPKGSGVCHRLPLGAQPSTLSEHSLYLLLGSMCSAYSLSLCCNLHCVGRQRGGLSTQEGSDLNLPDLKKVEEFLTLCSFKCLV